MMGEGLTRLRVAKQWLTIEVRVAIFSLRILERCVSCSSVAAPVRLVEPLQESEGLFLNAVCS